MEPEIETNYLVNVLYTFYRSEVLPLLREVEADRRLGARLKHSTFHLQPDFDRAKLTEWMLGRPDQDDRGEIISSVDQEFCELATRTLVCLLANESLLLKEDGRGPASGICGWGGYVLDTVIEPFLRKIGYRLKTEVEVREYEVCRDRPHPDSCWSGCSFEQVTSTKTSYLLERL